MRGRTSRRKSTEQSPQSAHGGSASRARPARLPRDLRIRHHPILTFADAGPVGFFFDGKPMSGRQGETIAAALAANGYRLFRHAEKTGRPRGFFCAVGKCASCLMVVDGEPNTMVCTEPLREGMKVERQRGRGRLVGRARTRAADFESAK